MLNSESRSANLSQVNFLNWRQQFYHQHRLQMLYIALFMLIALTISYLLYGLSLSFLQQQLTTQHQFQQKTLLASQQKKTHLQKSLIIYKNSIKQRQLQQAITIQKQRYIILLRDLSHSLPAHSWLKNYISYGDENKFEAVSSQNTSQVINYLYSLNNPPLFQQVTIKKVNRNKHVLRHYHYFVQAQWARSSIESTL